MTSHIRKCSGCGRYTTADRCPMCNRDTVNAHPAKYSPDDRYGKYRRMAESGKHGKLHDDSL